MKQRQSLGLCGEAVGAEAPRGHSFALLSRMYLQQVRTRRTFTTAAFSAPCT